MIRTRSRLLCASLVALAGASLHARTFAIAPPLIEPAKAPGAPKTFADPIDWPPTPDAVERALGAAYLSEDEKADKRVFFGRYSAADLNSPRLAARAALVRGCYDDPALDFDDADPLDRAEALIERGELTRALALLGDAHTPIRAVVLRARVFALQGDIPKLKALADQTIGRLSFSRIDLSAEDAVAYARLLSLRVKFAGPTSDAPGAAAADHHAVINALGRIRTQVDRFYWPAILAEAELLYDKDNKPEALEALNTVVTLNPTCAEAWTLLGRLTVDSFSFDKTQQVARRLDLLASPSFDAAAPDAEAQTSPPTSPAGLSLLARAALRQSEGSQALDALRPALTRLPKNPVLRALECAAEAVRFDFTAADAALAKFDADIGPSGLAHFTVGAALAEARQYAPARAYLTTAHDRAPHDPAPLIARGLLGVQSGDDADALASLEQAFALDPFNVRADNSLRLVRELATYQAIESPHFVIRYKRDPKNPTGADAVLAREMPAIMERIHAVVAGNGLGGIDFEPQSHGHPKTTIDLMPDHQWFGVRITGMPQIHTIAASTGPVIAMESPREGPGQSGPYDWERVVRHEYVHTVSLARTSNRIPHWFTEAAAVYLEQAPRDFTTCLLLARALDTDTLFDFDEINIAFTRPKKPTDRQQAYAQGHWMYEYIIHAFGPRAPLDLMDAYAKGLREEDAYQQVLKLSRAEFSERFKRWAHEQVVAWGLSLPDHAPTLKQLEAREVLTSSETISEDARKQLEMIAAGELRSTPNRRSTLDADTLQALGAVELPAPSSVQIAAWLAKHPSHPDVLELALTDALSKTSNLATRELVPLIERYAAARPVDPKPHQLLARMHLGLGKSAGTDAAAIAPQDAQAAIPHLEFLDQREQRTPLYALELARRYAALDDFPKALAKADRATRIDPFSAAAREAAAAFALQAKDLNTAERHLQALADIEPDQPLHKRRLEALKAMQTR